MTLIEKRLLAIIDRALAAGEPCPTNAQLAGMLDLQSVSGPCNVVSRLCAAGMITVEWPKQNIRIITITRAGRHYLDNRRIVLALPDVPVRPDLGAGMRPTGAGRVKDRPVDVSALPPVGDNDDRHARAAAKASNNAFLRACTRLAPRPPEPAVAPAGRFRHLPPPTLTGQAMS